MASLIRYEDLMRMDANTIVSTLSNFTGLHLSSRMKNVPQCQPATKRYKKSKSANGSQATKEQGKPTLHPSECLLSASLSASLSAFLIASLIRQAQLVLVHHALCRRDARGSFGASGALLCPVQPTAAGDHWANLWMGSEGPSEETPQPGAEGRSARRLRKGPRAAAEPAGEPTDRREGETKAILSAC